MLQSLGPAFRAVVQSPATQRFLFAVGAGVTTLYTIRTIDSVSNNLKARSAARKKRKIAAAEAKKAAKVEKATTTMVTEATPVAPDLRVVAEAFNTDDAIADAVGVVMEGASYNELRATAKSLGLDVGNHPTKESLAKAIVTYQANKNEDNSSN